MFIIQESEFEKNHSYWQFEKSLLLVWNHNKESLEYFYILISKKPSSRLSVIKFVINFMCPSLINYVMSSIFVSIPNRLCYVISLSSIEYVMLCHQFYACILNIFYFVINFRCLSSINYIMLCHQFQVFILNRSIY